MSSFRVRIKSVLLYYSVILATFLCIGGFFLMPRSRGTVIVVVSLIPVVVFLWLKLIYKYKRTSQPDQAGIIRRIARVIGCIVFFYSLILTTVISCFGYFASHTLAAIWSNLIFLPMAIFFWLLFYSRERGVK